MDTLRVCGSHSILATFVGAFLRNEYPDLRVELAEDTQPRLTSGIRIESVSTGRWLYISSMSDRDPTLVEELQRGARAVLSLNSSRRHFSQAMDVLLSKGDKDESFVPPDLMRWMAGAALARPAVETALTTRELEVLSLIAEGHSNAEIAEKLVISRNTVRSHVHALSVKLNASTRTKIVANARALNIPAVFGAEGPAGRRVAG